MPAKPTTKRNGKAVTKPKGNSATPPPDVLTLDGAAELLRVSANGLLGDVESGLVPGQFIAGEWRFSRSGLMAWLAAPPTPQPRGTRPPAGGVGFEYHDEDPEEIIAAIYRERKQNPVGK
jgi:hypothetical protein